MIFDIKIFSETGSLLEATNEMINSKKTNLENHSAAEDGVSCKAAKPSRSPNKRRRIAFGSVDTNAGDEGEDVELDYEKTPSHHTDDISQLKFLSNDCENDAQSTIEQTPIEEDFTGKKLSFKYIYNKNFLSLRPMLNRQW